MIPGFGLAPLGFLDVPPPQLIALAAEAGFASVNLRTAPAVPGGAAFPMRARDDLVRACRRRLAETGISVRAIEQVGLGQTRNGDALGHMLEAGAELGASRLLCSGDDPDLSLLADRCADLCRLAGQYGMAVDLEFMPFRALKTLEDAVAVVAAAAQKMAGSAPTRCICSGRVAASRASPPSIRPASGPSNSAMAPGAAPHPDRLAEEARERRLVPGRGALPLATLLAAYPEAAPSMPRSPWLARRSATSTPARGRG